jgi:hypothetical protein
VDHGGRPTSGRRGARNGLSEAILEEFHSSPQRENFRLRFETGLHNLIEPAIDVALVLKCGLIV